MSMLLKSIGGTYQRQLDYSSAPEAICMSKQLSKYLAI